jgi:hypothetical protein
MPQSTATHVGRVAASFLFAVEHLLDFILKHGVEIIRHFDFPLINPKRRLVFSGSGESKGTSFAIGFPALAIRIVWPLAASSTRRERWVFAWWILTTFNPWESGVVTVAMTNSSIFSGLNQVRFV